MECTNIIYAHHLNLHLALKVFYVITQYSSTVNIGSAMMYISIDLITIKQ